MLYLIYLFCLPNRFLTPKQLGGNFDEIWYKDQNQNHMVLVNILYPREINVEETTDYC